MFKLQRSFFYDLEALIQTSGFYRKYYLLFKSLDLAGISDKNFGVGCTGIKSILPKSKNCISISTKN